LRGKAEHLVLPGPLRWQVGEASNAHTTGKPAVDGRFDQIGCEKRKRDGHIDVSRAALFPLGDAVRTCCWISDEFIKPAAATGNRGDQSRPRLRTYRASPFGESAAFSLRCCSSSAFKSFVILIRLVMHWLCATEAAPIWA